MSENPITRNMEALEHQLQISDLKKEIERLKKEVDRKQFALVRIYRIFDENMHDCQLDLNDKERKEWMQQLAKEASHTTHQVNQAVEEKKPPKVVGVGLAGEKSGF